MVIHKLPNVLVIHLKRFSYGNMFAKITKPVQFSAEMLVPYGEKGKAKYELYGVVVHHGHSTHSGHYIAYVKVCKIRMCVWYSFFVLNLCAGCSTSVSS